MLILKVHFIDPNNRLKGKERRSKLLDPKSDLYKWVDNEYKLLIEKYGDTSQEGLVGSKRMDYHIELIKGRKEATDELLVERAQQLEGKEVIIPQKLSSMGRALVVDGPNLEGYGNTHITVAFFPKGVPSDY